jgi:long-chain fatty acid transport protein
MTGHHKRMLGFVGALVFLFSSLSLVYASGFTIYEQGVRALGRGGAFAATADDPTAIFFNPAGIGQLKGTHFTSGLSAIEPALQGHGDPFAHPPARIRGMDAQGLQ